MGERYFRVKITEIGVKEGTIGRKWAEIGTDEKGERVMGYTPEATGTVHYERELLTQEVVELDVNAVIRAINAIP